MSKSTSIRKYSVGIYGLAGYRKHDSHLSQSLFSGGSALSDPKWAGRSWYFLDGESGGALKPKPRKERQPVTPALLNKLFAVWASRSDLRNSKAMDCVMPGIFCIPVGRGVHSTRDRPV